MSAVRLLARRWSWVALGAVAAAGLGFVASGQVSAGPFGSSETRTAIASVQIQVDTPEPLVADLRASELTIGTQAVLLAERLGGEDVRAQIARRAGVPAAQLNVLSARTEIPGRSSPLSREAVAAASSPPGVYRLRVSAAVAAPIITVLAYAPDRGAALALAQAAAPALDAVTGVAAVSAERRVRIVPLAPPRVVERLSGGPEPALGVAAAVLLFAGWCWLILVADGIARAWRSSGPDSAATPVRTSEPIV